MAGSAPAPRLGLGVAILGVALLAACRSWGAGGVHHDLAVRLEPATREVSVEDTITVPAGRPLEFDLGRQFTVQRAEVDGAPAAIAPAGAPGQQRRWRLAAEPAPHPRRVALSYRGRLDPLPAADHREVLAGLPPFADPRGSYLPGGTGWYPEFEVSTLTYRISLDLPADQRGIAPGRLEAERVEADRYRVAFAFPDPAESIDLIAGPYQIRERLLAREGGEPIQLRTYFHAELAPSADAFLAAAAGYLEGYARQIGPYPYSALSVVSGPLPTGFAMPTLTYLGVEVLRLPFIRGAPLAHELLHNWWGNGVHVDYAQGNWSEGLTAFLADYAVQEREGAAAAREARLGLLRDVGALPPGLSTPLRRFVSRAHGASQVVGYQKGTFLFLMLRDLVGSAAFEAGLRRFWGAQRFRRASWADLRSAFEEASGRGLGPFFDQWLSRREVPRLAVEGGRVERAGAGFRATLVLTQAEPAFDVSVPLVVTTVAGEVERRVELRAARQEVAIEVAARPLAARLDPGFRVLRQLRLEEAPPILRGVMLDPAVLTVLASPSGEVGEAAMALARALLDNPPSLGDPAALPADAPLLVVGLAADVDRLLAQAGLPARPDRLRGTGTAQVWTARRPTGPTLAVVSAENVEGLLALRRPLPHYGRQSYLVFEGPRALERGTWPAVSPAVPLRE